MTENKECIICLDEDNLVNKDCNKCSGILIHEECFNELLMKNGTKCPHCRGILLRNGVCYSSDSDLDTNSSMDSEEAAEYINRFNERVIQRNLSNNIIINNNDNNNDSRIKNILKFLIGLLITCVCGWIVGCILQLLYCLMTECDLEYFTSSSTEMMKLCFGTVIYVIIIMSRSRRSSNSRRQTIYINNNVNRRNIQNRIV